MWSIVLKCLLISCQHLNNQFPIKPGVLVRNRIEKEELAKPGPHSHAVITWVLSTSTHTPVSPAMAHPTLATLKEHTANHDKVT